MANYTERAKILDSLDNYGTMNGELWSDSAPCCYFPRRYVVVALCFVCLLIIYLYRVILSVAILPIAEEYEWDDPTRGLVLSSFFWGYIFTQIPGGYLAQKYGGKVVLGTGVMFASLFTIVTPFFASQLPIFIVARFLTGFAEGVSYPTVHHLMARWLPKTERGAYVFFTLYVSHPVGRTREANLFFQNHIRLEWRSRWHCPLLLNFSLHH
jgi:sugar phosphate permease